MSEEKQSDPNTQWLIQIANSVKQTVTSQDMTIASLDMMVSGFASMITTIKTASSDICQAIALTAPAGKGVGIMDVAIGGFKKIETIGQNFVENAAAAKDLLTGTNKQKTKSPKGIEETIMSAASGITGMVGSMATMAMVIAPVTALIEGFLSPFQIVTDIFGSIGETVGMALMPIMLSMAGFLVQLLPTIMQLATTIAPLILILWQVLTPWGQFVTVFTAFSPLLMPVITILTSLIGVTAAIVNFLNPITYLQTLIANIFESMSGFIGTLTQIGDGIKYIAADIGGFVTKLWKAITGSWDLNW